VNSNKTKNPFIIACIPKDEDEQERLGVTPTKGVIYNPAKCDMCNCETLITQKQENFAAATAHEKWCAACVFKLKDIAPDKWEFVNLADFH